MSKPNSRTNQKMTNDKFWQFRNLAGDDQKAELLLYGDISERSWWEDAATPKRFADDLAALCSHIKQCNTALGDLSEATANGFEETDDILHEKQDVTAAVSFTIPVDGWGEDDSSPGYFYCDIPIAGLLATDIVDVTVLPEFYDVAGAVGFIATESLEGKLRLRAAKAPTEKISAQYHITSTVKYTDAQEGGT